MAINSNIQQNLIPTEPQLIDLLNLFKKDILLNFNSHHVGTIQSFNSSNQTASITINYKKTFFNFNSVTGVYESTLVDYPVIAEAPVIVMGGSTTSITFPIAAGDECLILFNDRDLDNWFTGGSGSPNATARLHSFADALAIVGLRSLANVISSYDSTRAVLRAGETSGSITAVGVNPSNSKVLITNTYPSNSVTLNTLLQTLMTDLENLVSALTTNAATFIAVTGSPGNPSPLNPAIVTALTNVSTSFSSLATSIGGLLE